MSVRVRSLSLDRFHSGTHLSFFSFGSPLELWSPQNMWTQKGKNKTLRQFFSSPPPQNKLNPESKTSLRISSYISSCNPLSATNPGFGIWDFTGTTVCLKCESYVAKNWKSAQKSSIKIANRKWKYVKHHKQAIIVQRQKTYQMVLCFTATHRNVPKLFATAHFPSHVPNSACRSPSILSSALPLRPAASSPGRQAPPSTRCALELSFEPPSRENLHAYCNHPSKHHTCIFSFPLAVCTFLTEHG